jgi:hypothetical protein
MNIIVKRVFAATLAVLTIAGVLAGSARGSLAGDDGWDHRWNGPVAAGILGGLAVGAIAGTRPGYNYYPPGYPPAPAYYDDTDQPPVYCRRVRQPLYNSYGDFAGYRHVRVCE